MRKKHQPGCPCCGGPGLGEYCCKCIKSPANDLVVDLGVGGWSGPACCSDIAGEYNSQYQGPDCRYTSGHVVCGGSLSFLIVLEQIIFPLPGWPDWRWSVSLTLAVPWPDPPYFRKNCALYRSTTTSDPCTDCGDWLENVGEKISLTKVTDGGCSGFSLYCTSGKLPSTIEMWEDLP